MNKKISIATVGLLILSVSPGCAGSMGRGASQRGGTSPEIASYVFCFGGNPGSVYFSDVIALAPSAQQPNLGIAFGRYLTAAGFHNDGGQCVHAQNRADAEAEMERREDTFVTRKIVHTGWTGESDDP
jgi:hypothetical protein